jgi:hypothetical protein
MEDGLTIVSKMQKLMRDNLQKVGQEISNLLDNKEQKDEQGTVIDLNARGPKT